MRFQADTGTQCNVVPLGVYKRATKDFALALMTPALSQITAYGGTTLPWFCSPSGVAWDIPVLTGLQVGRLLPHLAAVGNNQLNKPNTGDAPLYTVLEHLGPVSTEQLLEKHPTVFSKGVSLLESKHHLRLDVSVHPVQHSPGLVRIPSKRYSNTH